MTRRSLFALFVVPFARAASSIRGRLMPGRNLLSPEGREVSLTGDASTISVINDARLTGSDLEAVGEAISPGQFRIGPIHERNLFVHKDGKRLMISYWCAVCSIRTYAPGVCMCCQEETALDLRDKI
jgi:hypothetical protein